MKTIISILKEEQLACVVQQKDAIYRKSEHGILPLLSLYEAQQLQGAQIADKVVGKAAAMVMVYGGVKEVYAQTISQHALDIFTYHHIPVTYDTLVSYIINRKKDGMCPMEACVIDLAPDELAKAYTMLYQKVADMKRQSIRS